MGGWWKKKKKEEKILLKIVTIESPENEGWGIGGERKSRKH